MKKADVTVVIPVFNSIRTIDRAVKSVLEQTLLPTEIIIVDDCSTDNEFKEFLKGLNYDTSVNINVIYLSKNVGPGSARNYGIKNSKTSYIAFLDSDDVWLPRKLEIQYGYMKENSEVYFSCHNGIVFNENFKNDKENLKQFQVDETYSKRNIDVKYINKYRYLFKHYMHNATTSAVMIKKVPRMFFCEGKRYFEDYLLWLEYSFQYEAVIINLNLSGSFKNLYGDGGLSAELWNMEKGELETFQILKEKGFINSYMCVICKTFSLIKFLRRKFICLFR